MNKRQREARATIFADPCIQFICECEPEIRTILEDALQVIPEVNRWHEYERLKRQTSRLVGWYARCDDLQTSMHYLAVIKAIDTLLLEDNEVGVMNTQEVA